MTVLIIIQKKPHYYKGNIIELHIYNRFLKNERGCSCSTADHMLCVDDKKLLELYRNNRLDGEVKQYVQDKLMRG